MTQNDTQQTLERATRAEIEAKARVVAKRLLDSDVVYSDDVRALVDSLEACRESSEVRGGFQTTFRMVVEQGMGLALAGEIPACSAQSILFYMTQWVVDESSRRATRACMESPFFANRV